MKKTNTKSSDFEIKIKKFLKKHKIDFNSLSFYKTAFTLANYVNENPQDNLESNERLEYLGDAVLQLMVAQYIFKEFDKTSEGNMTLMRSKVVKKDFLAKKTRQLHLNELVRAGNGTKDSETFSEKTLSDLFESFIAALYLDVGFDKTFSFIKKHICNNIKENEDLKDYKTKLQELMQSEHGKSVDYVKIKEINVNNNQTFVIRVLFNDQVLGVGQGNSIKSAEQNAAKDALKKMSK